MRFQDPQYLWALWVVPVLLLLFVWGRWKRRRALGRLGDRALVARLMPDASPRRAWAKALLALAALTLVVLMVARPQSGAVVQRDGRNGIETIICLDVSNSMLARDVTPSRLDRSKMLVESLVDRFSNDKIGLVVFAGEAFVQLPITADYVSAKMFLQDANPSLIESQGTDIAGAIRLGLRSFTSAEHIGRAIIVITDGEDHEGQALEAAREARKKGVNVYILGVGTAQGAPIPTAGGGYMKDAQGQTVMTRLGEAMCREVAEAGQGRYIHVSNATDAYRQLNDDLQRLQRGDNGTVVYSAYSEQFQAFGVLALLLLVAEVLILEVKNPRLRNIQWFKKRAK